MLQPRLQLFSEMRATLEFILPIEKYEHRIAMDAQETHRNLKEFERFLREKCRHASGQAETVLNEVHERFLQSFLESL